MNNSNDLREREKLNKAVREKNIAGRKVPGILRYFMNKKHETFVHAVIVLLTILTGIGCLFLSNEFDIHYLSFSSIYSFYWIANIVIIKIIYLF